MFYLKKILGFIIIVHLSSCFTKQESNFNLQEWQALDLKGNPVRLSELNYKKFAINVYSPDCIPCVKEIPTMNLLYAFFEPTKLYTIYLVVDPYDIIESEETESFESIYPKAVARMNAEIQNKKIELPVLIMKKPFRVSTMKQGLITGRPETLLFKTFPLVLYYNFIGPISEAIEKKEIEKEPKVIFFKRMLGGI
jgi:thiol-disulfide isomerase/thioredoxin